MDNIPNDVLILIINIVDIDMLTDMYFTCQRFRELIEKYSNFSKLKDSSFLSKVKIYDFEHISRRSRQYLSLQKCTGRAAKRNDRMLFDYFFYQFPYDGAPLLYLLKCAAEGGDPEIINFIISQSLDAWSVDDDDYEQLIKYASRSNKLELVQALFGDTEALKTYNIRTLIPTNKDDDDEFSIYQYMKEADKYGCEDIYHFLYSKLGDISVIDDLVAKRGDIDLLKQMSNKISYERCLYQGMKYKQNNIVEYIMSILSGIQINTFDIWEVLLTDDLDDCYLNNRLEIATRYDTGIEPNCILIAHYMRHGLFDKFDYYQQNQDIQHLCIHDAIKYGYDEIAIQWLRDENENISDFIESAITKKRYAVIEYIVSETIHYFAVLNIGIFFHDLQSIKLVLKYYPETELTRELYQKLLDQTDSYLEVAYYEAKDYKQDTYEIYKLFQSEMGNNYVYIIAEKGRSDILELFLERPDLDYELLFTKTLIEGKSYSCVDLLLSKQKVNPSEYLEYHIHPRLRRLISSYEVKNLID